MKVFVFVAVILQVILCQGGPIQTSDNTPGKEINTTNLANLIEYAKPLILYYGKNYAGSTKSDDNNKGVSFSTDVITRMKDNVMNSGLIAGLRFLPYGTFVIVVWKMWNTRDSPEGQYIRKYLKENHKLDLDPMLTVIDANVSCAGDKVVQNIQNIDAKTISEAGEYIYGVLSSASIDATAWKNSISSNFGSVYETLTKAAGEYLASVHTFCTRPEVQQAAKSAWNYVSGTAASWYASYSLYSDNKEKTE